MEYGKNLSHAYIIAAQPAEGFERARELSAAMLCQSAGARPCGVCKSCVKAQKGIHPDVIIVERLKDDKGNPKREIYIDQIREMAASAPVLPNEAEKKVYIIRDAGTMNTGAQNALLKLLEEPPAFASFILICDSAGLLLETVRSRCVMISLNGEPDAPGAEARGKAEKYLSIAAQKNITALLAFANENGTISPVEAADFSRAVVELLTEMLCGSLPDMGLSRRELMRLVNLFRRVQQYLRFNVGVKHIFGLLTVRTIEMK